MSRTASAFLYYGTQIGEPGDGEPGDGEHDHMDLNRQWASGHRPPEPPEHPAPNQYRGPDWDAWRDKLTAYEATVEHVEIDFSGSGDSADDTWFVHCPCLERRVEWAEQIDLGRGVLLQANHEADTFLRAFCNQFGLPYRVPSWHLACCYF